MEKPIDRKSCGFMAGEENKQKSVMAYDRLRQKIFAIVQAEPRLLGESIPAEVAVHWRIGQELYWHAEELLENLALDLRRECEKPWNVHDLTAMIQLYFRCPTVEGLSSRYTGRKPSINPMHEDIQS